MVRKGSSVRVRQRAWGNLPANGKVCSRGRRSRFDPIREVANVARTCGFASGHDCRLGRLSRCVAQLGSHGRRCRASSRRSGRADVLRRSRSGPRAAAVRRTNGGGHTALRGRCRRSRASGRTSGGARLVCLLGPGPSALTREDQLTVAGPAAAHPPLAQVGSERSERTVRCAAVFVSRSTPSDTARSMRSVCSRRSPHRSASASPGREPA